jgi:uncharacterized membrane protein YgcG
VRGNTLTLVEGAEASIRGTTTRALAAAAVNGESLAVDGATFATPLLRPGDGLSRTFTWKDIHGLEAKAPLDLTLVSIPDEAPELYAHQVEAKRMILEDEVVTFDVNANDDFGLREVGLEWRRAESVDASTNNPAGEKPVASGAPEKMSVQTRGTFSAKREGIAPGTYQVRVFANDFLPNRPRTYSPAFVLQILSPQEHAKWLTEEFAKWFRNARETYEREQQLHESNLALRELAPEELDRPENRRRLQDQASAESANSRRLDSLTSAGRGLVGEAAKNPEFDAQRLEKWAGMMRALDQIARERMPTVADLLQQASRAPGGPSSETPGKTSEPDKPTSGESASSPPSPALGDREKGLTPEQNPGDATPQGPTPPSPSRLPATTLAAADDDANGKSSSPRTPVQKTLERAVEEQKKLLEEFARVADELAAILASLEASTFVKRLKLASRKQTELADTLAGTLSGAFGLPRQRVGQPLREIGEAVAKAQEEQSRFVHHIQTDLEAYFQRKQDPIYRNVLDQMKDQSIVPGLRDLSAETLGNLNGRSVSAAEYWADTLDRWAEELVAAAPPQEGQGQQGDMKSLPPEIVLRIMKVLQEEMQLRDETREMEETRPAFAPDVYASKVRPLSTTQAELRERIDEVVTDISGLPDAGDFGNEVELLGKVSDTMRQAHAVLLRPDTGPEAIAYETEVIELLLQSKRQQSGGGGGGGGGSNSGGGNTGGGKGSALSDVGPQDRATEGPAPLNREVEQSTGKAGRELPEEFRRGLDSYFNELESN